MYCTLNLMVLCLISLNPYYNSMRKVLLYYDPPFADEEIEA